MSSEKIRQLLITLLKISVAVGLLSYLVYSGRLDFKELITVFSDPVIAISTVTFWLLGPSILGSVRWRLLLSGAGYEIDAMKAFHLQIMGFFFNTAMPGAVGGDIIKVVYVVKQSPEKGKSPAIMSVFLDRVIGLAALFLIGLIAAVTNYQEFLAQPILFSFVVSLALICLGIALFFAASLYHYKKLDPFQKLLQMDVPGFSHLLKIYEALRTYRFKRAIILKCFLLSIVIQIAALVLFYAMTNILLGHTVDITKIATIFPIGMLTTALPLAPGGLGVGHLAFEKLFHMVGLENGANVANAYMLSLLALNLIGIISYLRYKKDDPLSKLEMASES